MNNKIYIKTFLNLIFYIVIIILIIGLIIAYKSKDMGKQPQLFGYSTYTILSGSMTPTIKIGSIVIVKEIKPENIKEKDVITFLSKNSSNVTTHRVNRILTTNPLSFSTKGDANSIEDPVPVEKDQVIGKVAFHIVYLGDLINIIKKNKIISVLLITVLMVVICIPKTRNKSKAINN